MPLTRTALKLAEAAVPEFLAKILSRWMLEVSDAIDAGGGGLAAHIADPTDAHDASAISSIPSGNLAATEVQGALNELQTDVDTRATSSALSTHIADTATHGATGAVVGTTNTQNLTNKTFTDTVKASVYAALTSSTLSLLSYIADGASAIGTILDSQNALSTAGAKLLSIRNATVEKAYFTLKGALNITGPSSGDDGVVLPAGVLTRSDQVKATGATTLTLKGGIADGASVVNVVVDSVNAITTSSARVFTVKSNGSELVWVSGDGGLRTVNVSAPSAALTLKGGTANGSTAVGIKTDTENTFSTAGAKLISIRNASTEKAFIDKDGLVGVGNLTTANLPTPATALKGLIAFDTTTGTFKFCDGTSWLAPAGGAVFAPRTTVVSSVAATNTTTSSSFATVVSGSFVQDRASQIITVVLTFDLYSTLANTTSQWRLLYDGVTIGTIDVALSVLNDHHASTLLFQFTGAATAGTKTVEAQWARLSGSGTLTQSSASWTQMLISTDGV